ncbi:MAG: hypothetical protein GC136_01615 [Alphaproteobacteria bacterium]|nr:hypothetical protein [Alphaproteobacteria bacterium]
MAAQPTISKFKRAKDNFEAHKHAIETARNIRALYEALRAADHDNSKLNPKRLFNPQALKESFGKGCRVQESLAQLQAIALQRLNEFAIKNFGYTSSYGFLIGIKNSIDDTMNLIEEEVVANRNTGIPVTLASLETADAIIQCYKNIKLLCAQIERWPEHIAATAPTLQKIGENRVKCEDELSPDFISLATPPVFADTSDLLEAALQEMEAAFYAFARYGYPQGMDYFASAGAPAVPLPPVGTK